MGRDWVQDILLVLMVGLLLATGAHYRRKPPAAYAQGSDRREVIVVKDRPLRVPLSRKALAVSRH